MANTGDLAVEVIESNTLSDVELRLAAQVLALRERNREQCERIAAGATGVQVGVPEHEVLGLLRGTHRWAGNDVVEVGAQG